MNDMHEQFFTLRIKQLDERPLPSNQRAELEAHLDSCPSCRAGLQLYQDIHAQANQRWQAPAPSIELGDIVRRARTGAQVRQATLVLRAAAWVIIAVGAILLIQWVFTDLRPSPAAVPTVILFPNAPTPTPDGSSIALPQEAGSKLPLEPVLHGIPSGRGMWSPGGDYFFIAVMDVPPLGGDRGTMTLHFISVDTGEDCISSETFLIYQMDDQNDPWIDYSWIDNEHVLFIDQEGRALLFTRCQEGVQDLSDSFGEPLVRVAQPLISQELAAPGALLLESASAYWLLDPATLEARPLSDPLPSPDQVDDFGWLPAVNQIVVVQPVVGSPEQTRLVLLDWGSGEVLRSLEVEASSEGYAPIVEWINPQRPFIWSFGQGGPLLVDLSVDPPEQVRVLPKLLGLDLAYPDEVHGMGVFYTGEGETFHIVTRVNLPDDQSIYLYHSENGEVEQLGGDRQMMFIFPGDQRMPTSTEAYGPASPEQIYDDGYDVLWVDAPERPQVHIEVSGHNPRNYSMLQSRLLPGGERMLFTSTQGISLVDLLTGRTLAFWGLSGAENALLPSLSVSPNGRTAVSIADTGTTENQGSYLYLFSWEE